MSGIIFFTEQRANGLTGSTGSTGSTLIVKPAFRQLVKPHKKFIFSPTICPDLTNHHANVGLRNGKIPYFFHQKKTGNRKKGGKT
jgi:hypothetical protein